MGCKQKKFINYPDKKGEVELIRFKIDLKIFLTRPLNRPYIQYSQVTN